MLDSILKSERNRLINTANGKAKMELLERQVANLRGDPAQVPGIDNSGRFRIVQSEDALTKMLNDLSDAEMLTLDVETTGTDPFADTLVGFGLCANSMYGYYTPVGHDGAPGQIPFDIVIDALKPLLTTKGIVAHNAKFEYMFMKRLGINLNLTFDTMIAVRIADERLSASLKEAAPQILDIADWGLDLEQRPANKRPVREVGIYCIRDCLYTHQLFEKLEPIMRTQFPFVYHKVEMPLVPVMAEMELAGLPVNAAYLDEARIQVAERRETLTKEIHDAAGHEFNINSNPQLSEVLFEELGLVAVEWTDAGKPSTSAEALEKIGPAAHPIIGMILEYKGYEKLQSSYLKPDIKQATGRVHPSYFQIGTETGRMTGSGSFHPLTFPKDGVHPISLRKAIGGVDGFAVVCADFSSQEPRITAAYSGDAAYMAPFTAGESSHGHVAKMMFELSEGPNEIKKTLPEKYAIAKIINLGLVYGMSEFSLAKRLTEALRHDISSKEAKDLIEKFFAKFPGVKTWLDAVIARAKQDGFVEDLAGRRRHLPILKEKCPRGDKEMFRQQKGAEREATNFMVQGLAATQTKLAMIRCHRRLAELHPRVQIIAARHDELMFLIPDDEIDAACAVVKQCMENDPELGQRGLIVTPEAEITFGKTWSANDQKPWEPKVTEAQSGEGQKSPSTNKKEVTK